MNKNKNCTSLLLGKFEERFHLYSTHLLTGNYRKPQIELRKSRFRVSIRGQTLWNNFVESNENYFILKIRWPFLYLLLLKKNLQKERLTATNFYNKLHSCLHCIIIDWDLMTKSVGFSSDCSFKILLNKISEFCYFIRLVFDPF